MNSTPLDLWVDEKARRAGHPSGASLCAALDVQPYRLRQIYRAATKELVADVAEVTTLPVGLRASLRAQGLAFDSLMPVVVQHSSDGQTTKGLFRTADGSDVEAVLMEHHGGRSTVCISSQAGCAYACAFCATGQAGFTRNLEATEIFDQARFFARELASREKKITNVVFMGMGEPFANYEAVMKAVRLLQDPQGFGLGHRHITISTVGLVPQIDRFAAEGIQVNLAISLHAPTDELRSKMMPVNRKYPIEQLMAACERYIARTHRKIFFEYVMLAGVNDRPEDAVALARLMRGPLYHVNLIPYNATPNAELKGSPELRIRAFQKELESRGAVATVRVPMGRDIAAACGQLRAETQPKARAAV
ncbi:MAG: 23S rRNA (adenine(2503)-C(2))-methyltransferase RlmN [Candidatus Eremiobacteraeota bacterium]|nr:23S rRNA (adenine(2503)-C(2))-methyltransferase RlmN [Candidatus Eremiobacteraeota bacterium]MBV8354195.1 23S rRNA (adenine(2503)-C(2))-methyltransferase RlmN [Candidatus Eremiobacteraeota bacterium]